MAELSGAVMARFARYRQRCQANEWRDMAGTRLFVPDFEFQLFGVLDPARHDFLRGQWPGELGVLHGALHPAREINRVAVAQFAHRVDARGLEQLRAFAPDALYAHAVRHVGAPQDDGGVGSDLLREHFATVRRACRPQELLRRPDLRIYQFFRDSRTDAVNHADRIGHQSLRAPAAGGLKV